MGNRRRTVALGLALVTVLLPTLFGCGRGEPVDNGPALQRSMPVRLSIPAIGVDSAKVETVGLDTDGQIETPPYSQPKHVGWYGRSVTPGERGAAVIVGHFDTLTGLAVFYRLGNLVRGDTIQIRRADGKTAFFLVDAVRRYPRAKFPSQKVYGKTDRAGLRLITCGGHFDRKKQQYTENVVVFASFLGT